MKHNITYSKEARHDLDEIWDYIVSDLQNVSAAENTVNHIMDAVDQLEDFPEMGARLSSIAQVDSGHRYLISGNYMVFYRVVGKDVFIDRVLYARSNYLRTLLEYQPQ